MRNPIHGAQFRRDVRLAQKRGKDMAQLREVILLLIEGNTLPAHYKDHPLSGDWKHYRDCHIEPDWLLIYKTATFTSYALERTPICSERAISKPQDHQPLGLVPWVAYAASPMGACQPNRKK